MSISEITFDFKIKERVHIRELELNGTVIGLYVGDTGIQYQVRYFSQGEAKTVYFYAHELKEA